MSAFVSIPLPLSFLVRPLHSHHFFDVPISSTSLIRCGSGEPNVSGKTQTRRPETSERLPKMRSGTKAGRRPTTAGAIRPPIRDIVEHVPTAVGRMAVGYSSAV